MPKPTQDEYKKKYTDLVAKLNDPTFVAGLAKQKGATPPEKKNFTLPEFKLDLGKVDDSTDVTELMTKFAEQLKSWVASSFSGLIAHNEQQAAEQHKFQSQTAEAAKIRAFADAHPDFSDHLEKINAFYQKGHSLEDSYRLARLEAGIKDDAPAKDKGKQTQSELDEEDELPPTPPDNVDEETPSGTKNLKPKPSLDIRKTIENNVAAAIEKLPDLG